jgi:microcystin-dependent protein
MSFRRGLVFISELVADIFTVGNLAGNRATIRTFGVGLGASSLIEFFSGAAGESPGTLKQVAYADGDGPLPAVELHSCTTPSHLHESILQLFPTNAAAPIGGLIVATVDTFHVTGTLEAGAVLVGGAPVQVPPGAITMFGGPAVPSGWIRCDGTAVSRTTFAALFAVVGTSYGPGDGATTFNVPDFTSRGPRGAARGTTGGADTAVIAAANLPAHAHGVGSIVAANESAHTHTTPDHNHPYDVSATAGTTNATLMRGNATVANTITGGYNPSTSGGGATGAGAAHTHALSGSTDNGPGASTALPVTSPWLGVTFIIKD